MLKKEFQGVLKHFLFFLAVSAGVSLLIKMVFAKDIGTYTEVFFLFYSLSLLIFGFYMGLSVFLADMKQGAGDYVFSLPYSRLRLLEIKVLPRVTAVLVYFLLYLWLYHAFGQKLIVAEVFFGLSWLYWLLFLVSLSFSASAESYMKVGGVGLLGVFLFLGLFTLAPNFALLMRGSEFYTFKATLSSFLLVVTGSSLWLIVLITLCFLLPYLISFIFAFKKWGNYSKVDYNKGFAKLFVPLITASFLLSVFLIFMLMGPGFPNYYLTEKQQLIESGTFNTRLYGSDGIKKWEYPRGHFYYLFEDDKYLYGQFWGRESIDLMRFHQENGTFETLKKTRRQSNLNYIRFLRYFDNIITVPEGQADSKEFSLVFIDTRSSATRKMIVSDILPPGYLYPTIFGADRDPGSGKTFWLIHSEWSFKYPIIKLWEHGKVENLGILSDSWPVYINRILITKNQEGYILSKITSTGVETIKKVPGYKRIWFSILNDRFNLNPTAAKDIYCIRKNKGDYFRLDTTTLELSRLAKIPGNPFHLFATKSGDVYGLEYEHEGTNENVYWAKRKYITKIFRLEGEKFALVKEFPPYKDKQEGDYFWVSDGGVVIRKNRKLSIYTFPDLKPLELK